MTYLELREKHQNEFNDCPMKFAFGKEQFVKMMAGWGLTAEDTDKVFSFRDTGGYYLKSDEQAIFGMFDRQEKERQQAMDDDTTGENYIYQMFACTLSGHEYGYTYELDDTLESLDLTLDQIRADKRLLRGLNKALKKYGTKRIKKKEE